MNAAIALGRHRQGDVEPLAGETRAELGLGQTSGRRVDRRGYVVLELVERRARGLACFGG